MRLSSRIGLSFDGRCEAAFQFYESCFRGKITFLLRWGDSPTAQDVPEEWHSKILHAGLSVEGVDLLGGDGSPGTYEPPRGFSILLSLDDPAEADRIFHALAENGNVQMALQETFWASRFGAVRVFTTAMGCFGLFSALCGFANSFTMLVIGRILQGVAGGPLIPLSQTLLLRIFPKEKAAAATALWAMTSLVAPILGPILGGYLCDSYTWPLIFLINVPIAIASASTLVARTKSTAWSGSVSN